MDINIRNCQIATISTKTHNIIVASKVDVLDTEKVINDFFSKFEIIRIVPLVSSKELIKPMLVESKPIQTNTDKRTSVLSQYLQVKDLLKDSFTASTYCDTLKIIGLKFKVQSVYYSLNKLMKLGKININKNTLPITYTKIYIEHEPMPSMVKERQNLIDSFKT